MPISHMMRRWKEEIGSRSRRAPAFTVAASSFLPCEHGQASSNQGFKGRVAVLFERLLLGGEKKFLASPGSRGIESQNTFYESVSLTRQTVDRP